MQDMPTPYEGDKPYIFVSYAHADKDAVLPMIKALMDEGFRVWYDAGIEPAEPWTEYIANHVYGCVCFVALISKAALASHRCMEETEYAHDLNRTILPIHLEKVELTRGLQMSLGRRQALFWYEYDSDDAFYAKLFKARRLDDCLTDEGRRRRGVKPRPAKQESADTKVTKPSSVAPKADVPAADKPTATVPTPPPDRPTEGGAVPPASSRPATTVQPSGAATPRSGRRDASEGVTRVRDNATTTVEVLWPPQDEKTLVGVSGLSVTPKPTLENYTWAELKAVASEIAAARSDAAGLDIAKVYGFVGADGKLQGATKEVVLGDKTKAHVRIAGFRHDELASGGGLAGITFEFADVPARHRMNRRMTNAGGWDKSEMRSWLNRDFLGLLPGDLSKHIVAVQKRTNNTGKVDLDDASVVTTTHDRLWLLSATEVYGNLSLPVYDAEGVQYQLYADMSVSHKDCAPASKDGARSWWWLRSPGAYDSWYFHYVLGDGGWNWYSAYCDWGVSPGFCF